MDIPLDTVKVIYRRATAWRTTLERASRTICTIWNSSLALSWQPLSRLSSVMATLLRAPYSSRASSSAAARPCTLICVRNVVISSRSLR